MKGSDLCNCGKCLICKIVKDNKLSDKELIYSDTESMIFER